MSNTDFWMRLKNLLLSLIIGSGAFNLLVISAIRCRPPRLLKSWYIGQFFPDRPFFLSTAPPFSVFVIPEDETRRVKTYAVFLVTMFWSIFAFIWLFIIIAISSRDKVILLSFCEQGNKCDLKGGDLGGKRNSGVHSCHDLDQVWRWCSKLPYSVLSRLVLLILIFSFLSLITSAKVRDRKTQQGN